MSLFGLIRGLRISDNTVHPLRLDKATNTLQIIDRAHHEIHAGVSYSLDFKLDLPGGDNADILLITPNSDRWAHFLYEIEAEAEIDFGIYEGTTPNNNGTPVPAFNRDRNSTIAPTTLAYHTPTIASGNEGARIRFRHEGSGKLIGGSDRSAHEIILKQNTKYLIRVTNVTTSLNYIAIRLDWYEHINIA
jgi:hypothetical protein